MTAPWRGDHPRLTALDVPGVPGAAFPLTPWGRRGYDQGAADAFLERVRDELEAAANDVTELREEVMRLRRRFISAERGGEWMADAEEAHAMAVAIVSEAQQTADRYVAGAQEYAGRLAEDAAGRREAMLAEAGQVLAAARAQALDAADAALDEPVPEQAHVPLRAARAIDAYGRTFNRVYLANALVLAEALHKMLGDWKEHDAGGQGPGDDDRVPAQAALNTITRKEP